MGSFEKKMLVTIFSMCYIQTRRKKRWSEREKCYIALQNGQEAKKYAIIKLVIRWTSNTRKEFDLNKEEN